MSIKTYGDYMSAIDRYRSAICEYDRGEISAKKLWEIRKEMESAGVALTKEEGEK